jgi:hypothetical protein
MLDYKKKAIKYLILGWVITVTIYLTILCGVIYFIFWCLKHFGVIH